MEFELKVVLQCPDQANTTTKLDYKVVFSNDPQQYGSGFYMVLQPKESPRDLISIDLRYSSYKQGEELKFIFNWASEKWTGKNYSWAIKKISVERIA